MYLSLKTFSFKLLFILLSFLVVCCKKEKSLSEAEIASQKLVADASYNNSIATGFGNLIYEQKLIPNSASQLISKLAYNGDTLATYGKINSNGRLAYISSTILSTKGNTEFLVTEIFPEISKSRMYTMTGNKKSNFIIELDFYSSSKYTISLLDVDWVTNTSKTLKSSLIVDGKVSSQFSSFRIMEGDRSHNCPEPEPTDDPQKRQDEMLAHANCQQIFLIFGPIMEEVEKLIKSAEEKVGQKIEEIKNLEQLKKLLEIRAKINKTLTESINKLKFSKVDLQGLLNELENLLSLPQDQKVEVSLVPFELATDTDYDEVTDNEVKITFTVVEKSNGLPYTRQPVFIDMNIFQTGTNNLFSSLSKPSSTVNGLVVFKFDPTTIPDYQNITSLEAVYAFSGDNFKPFERRPIALKYIKPKVVFAEGSTLPNPIPFTNDAALPFKLVNEDGRSIPIDYNLVTIGSKSNPNVSIFKTVYANDFSLRLSTSETTSQQILFDVVYKNKKVQTVNATVNDSIAIYKAAIIGNWVVPIYTVPGNKLYYTDYVSITPNNIYLVYKNEQTNGIIINYDPPLKSSWNVIGNSTDGYRFTASGQTSGRLSIPVTSMIATSSILTHYFTRQ